MSLPLLGAGPGVDGGGYTFVNAEAEAVSAAMLAAGSDPNTARKEVMDTLVGALKTADIWDDIDLCYVPAAHSAAASLINWKNPGTFDLIAVNSPTFETDRGYTGDGATSYLRTQYTPSTHAVNYAQDSAAIGVWSRTAGQSANIDLGVTSAVASRLLIRNASNQSQYRINDSAAATAGSITDGSGLFMAQRQGADDRRLWRNGTQVHATTGASTGLPAAEVWICGASAVSFSARQQSFVIFAASLAGKELSLYDAVAAYMTSVGA